MAEDHYFQRNPPRQEFIPSQANTLQILKKKRIARTFPHVSIFSSYDIFDSVSVRRQEFYQSTSSMEYVLDCTP